MTIEPGRTLLHYRVVEKIGEGGMGEVWKAVDTTLDREVAIKFLPEAFAGDAERLSRFEREAKMLAALNHPNIAAVYGLHEADGKRFIAMEMVPGEDLAERLKRGPLAVEDAVDVARQVADALEAAHERGVIHRDLKPANVTRMPDGKIKVLDLGLAKALAPEAASDSGTVSLSPTVTTAGTAAGTLLGTAAYMSPEQAKGRPVDRRADIWAFGVVLHEMLSGERLFEEETVSETLAAVLRDEVAWESFPGEIPAEVRSLLARCLDRDPRTRLRDIGEARIALSPESLARGATAQTAVAPIEESSRTLARGLPWALVVLLGLVTAIALWRAASVPEPPAELLSLVAPIPEDLRLPADQMGVLALSPDGRTLAITLEGEPRKMLYVRRLDSPELVELAGTEDAATPFFSPDGQWIGFFADDKLKKVPVGGGSPVTLGESDGSNRGADWGTDGYIVYSPHYTLPLMRLPEAGGKATPLTSIDRERGERTHRWPQAVPGEDVVLFTVGTMDSPESYDDSRIDAIRPSTGERRTVLEGASMARYLPSGHLVFAREGFLFAVPFDIGSLETRGNSIPVLENVMGMRSSGVVHIGFADNGLLAYVAGGPRSRQSRLAWRYRDGRTEPLAAPIAGYLNPRISPDGKRLVAQVEGPTTFDIWTYDFEQETYTRLTFEGNNTSPAWSPDGRRIAFASVRDNALMSAYVKAADGSGQAELVYSPERHENAGQVVPRGWTPDGKSMIMEFTNENAVNLLTYSEETGEGKIFLETPAAEQAPALSPDGRWLAYTSDEVGDFQVFVRAYPGPGGKWQVSIGGGTSPRWSPDGKELFFRHQDAIWVVKVETDAGTVRFGSPVQLFDGLSVAGANVDYDVLDSERLLVVENVGDDATPPGVTVVVNWLDDLRRRVP